MQTNYSKAIDTFQKMDEKERHATLLALLDNGTINIAEAISAYGSHLEKFKEEALYDIGRLGTAGLDLAEKQIKMIPKMKNERRRHVAIAQAAVLLSTRVYDDTPFGNELYRCVDLSELDKRWFNHCWQLRTAESLENHPKEATNDPK